MATSFADYLRTLLNNPSPTGTMLTGEQQAAATDAAAYYADPFRKQNSLNAALEALKLEEEAKKKAAEANAGLLSSGSYKPEDTNPEWTNKTDAEKAAWYAANPMIGYLTNNAQQYFANTGLGMLQNMLDPNIQTKASLIALGINPSMTSNMGGLGAVANEGYAGLAALGYSPMQQAAMIRDAINSRAEMQAPAPVEDIGSMVGYQSSGGGYNPSSYTSGGNSNDGDGSGGYSLGGFFSGRGESGD